MHFRLFVHQSRAIVDSAAPFDNPVARAIRNVGELLRSCHLEKHDPGPAEFESRCVFSGSLGCLKSL